MVGPGMGTDDDARSVLAEVLGTDLPVVVDADGLTLLADDPSLVRGRTAPTLLTPHDREFARFGAEPGDPTGWGRPAASPPTSAAPSCSRARRPSSPAPTGRRS